MDQPPRSRPTDPCHCCGRKLADTVVIRHRCDCATATEPPGEDGIEHVFRIDGVDFPWHITEKGPIVTRPGAGEVLYTVTVEILAEHVDAAGVQIKSRRHRRAGQ